MQQRRSYAELSQFSTIIDRFNYLSLKGEVGDPTFGSRRYLNQSFYRSPAWRQARDIVIVRDGGCDLGIPGYDIPERGVVHHINPLTVQQIMENSPALTDLNNLILCTHDTHNAIHYGDESLLPREFIPRYEGDTKDW